MFAGLDKKLYIKIISLKNRIDRRTDCEMELNGLIVSDYESLYFDAKPVADNGAIGCSLSHAQALSEFLFNSYCEYCLILEDDFHIESRQDFIKFLDALTKRDINYDVFLFGQNQIVPIEGTKIKNVFRVINSQTTVGYLVTREFAPTLIKCFYESAFLLKKYESLPEQNYRVAKQFFCMDILWKKLQIDNIFLARIPPLIKQRESFSDIEKRVVRYGV